LSLGGRPHAMDIVCKRHLLLAVLHFPAAAAAAIAELARCGPLVMVTKAAPRARQIALASTADRQASRKVELRRIETIVRSID